MRRSSSFFLIAALFIIEIKVSAQGQLRGANMLEYQLGNIPDLKPEYQSSLYDQLNLSYKYKSFTFQTRAEIYQPSFGDEIGYSRISQFRAKYKSKKLSVSVGHINSTLGKGFLLRSYEIPGSIWEDRSYRVRYGFYKDVEGAEIKYKLGRFSLKGVYGKVLDVALPPTLSNEDRRTDLVQGAELSYQYKKLQIGGIYMNHKNENINDNYVSAYFKSSLFKKLSFHGELAVKAGSETNMSFENDSSYAAYLSFNYLNKGLGISVELKDYKNFSIGSGISDPPTLIKEHSYRLLNRSTHVPILTHERGYQLEVYYRLPNNSLITFNHALAENKLSDSEKPVYKELFAEYQFGIGDNITSNLFFDYATDPFTNEINRYTTGFIFDVNHRKMNSVLEAQFQFVERESIFGNSNFSNMYFSYRLQMGHKFSSSLLMEISNDPFLLEENESQAFYPGATITYRPNNKNIISLFYGKRRGGPACNSGVCYDVLDFQGLEIRILSNF